MIGWIGFGLVAVFVYAVIGSVLGQTAYKINYNKCSSMSHTNCEHGFWYVAGTFWPLSIVVAAIGLLVYVVLAGPLKIGGWVSNSASNWKVFND